MTTPHARRPRIGIRIPASESPAKLADFARRAEDAGVDRIWLPDSQMLWRDIFVSAGFILDATSHMQVGSLVTNLRTRHPSVLASACRTLQESWPGRFVLGLGRGGTGTDLAGLRSSRTAELREGIRQIIALQRGESVRWVEEGEEVRMKEPAEPAPVYLAATGPRTLELAGEEADGVILFEGADAELISSAIEKVSAGLEQRDPVPDKPLAVVTCSWAAVTDDVEGYSAVTAPLVAYFLSTGGERLKDALSIELRHPVENATELMHAEDWDAAVEVARKHVSHEDLVTFATRFCLLGTPAEIAERLSSLTRLGVTDVCLRHFGNFGLPDGLIADLSLVTEALAESS